MSTNNQLDAAAPVIITGAAPGTTVTLPSELAHVEPIRVDQATQQGSTQPGDGSVMRNVVVDPPTWREKFIGYAKKYRGAMLRQSETKEHGNKILQGRATVDDPNQVPERSGHLQ